MFPLRGLSTRMPVCVCCGSSIQFKCAYETDAHIRYWMPKIHSRQKNRYFTCTTYTVRIKWARQTCIQCPRTYIHIHFASICFVLDMCAASTDTSGTPAAPTIPTVAHTANSSNHNQHIPGHYTATRLNRMQTSASRVQSKIKRMQNSTAVRTPPKMPSIHFMMSNCRNLAVAHSSSLIHFVAHPKNA